LVQVDESERLCSSTVDGFNVESRFVDKDRAKEILEAMQKLVEESRRLIKAHNETLRKYERLKEQYDRLRKDDERGFGC